MATLYVENVPNELYEALRERARQHRKSVAAEVVSLLEENVVTAQERRSRQQFLQQIKRFRSRRTAGKTHFPASEELQRQDRSR